MNSDIIIGCNLIKQANLTITPDSVTFSKPQTEMSDASPEPFIFAITDDIPKFDIVPEIPKQTHKQIDEWTQNGTIQSCSSAFATQVLVVRKTDGSPGVCIDVRKLNHVLVKDHYPLPLIEDILDKLPDTRVFSTIDLRNGFFHVPVNKQSRPYTSFVTQNVIMVDFHKRILFSDEAHFWLNGYVNKQNCRIWSEANPQVYVETPLHPETLTELWFQQDGATCHTARATIDLLKDTFGDRLISRFGPVNWPPRSCDLTPLDYFLWGYVKSLVYADKPQTLDHLEDNIRRVIADIRQQMLVKVIENWTSRLDYIRASRGSPMPEIIFKM
ncbi:histone-lysine N-methyltransferase SETMAR [Trichonephila clavipes]|nr:histone-lysine N-methyltransferase SETMAR [Trichonephila clavipes]